MADYHSGFAPRDGEPLYPELQVGCAGDWSPGLGPTGTVLRDWSGRANHGTLTNMDPGTDWTPSSGRWALDFDGSNDYVRNTKAAITSTTNITLSAWVYISSTSMKGAVLKFGTAGNGYAIGVGSGTFDAIGNSLIVLLSGVAWIDFGSPLAIGWRHIAATRDATTWRGFVDGIQRATTSTSSPGAPTSDTFIGAETTAARFWAGMIGGTMCHSRVLAPQEIRLLATRRGIAHELAPVRYAGESTLAYRRRLQAAQLIGGGLIG